ncbi:MAG TPA: hypothetical protein VLF20_02320, partial [Patescibacteria group bacterium]|nr:hypothetical protein [Patescibacteria group bacterium]
MNKDGDPRRRTPDRRGRGTGDPRNRRPSRDRTLQPHERQRGDYDLRATLTLFAQGKLLGGTAATRKESTTNVTRRINQFREENGIIRRPEDSSTADYIRVVFHAIDGGYVIRRTIMQSHPDAFSSLEDISRDPRLDATIRYFSLLDSRQPITDRLLFTR